MEYVNRQIIETPYGELILGSFDQQLCLCDWRYRKARSSIDARVLKGLQAEFVDRDDEVLAKTREQLSDYFHHQRKEFNLPLLMVGSEFQKKVWEQLLQIPFGSTLSYSQLADKSGSENAIRAVASANGANAISIIIPCHRVIGINGDLAGYAGGIKTKAHLLALESDLFDQ